MDLQQIGRAFQSRIFRNEDDVKIHFHADIIKPLLEELNPASEQIREFKGEPALAALPVGSRVQFERQGYFCLDPDSTPERPVWKSSAACPHARTSILS